MPDNILGGQGATLLMAIVIVAIALLALVGVFWIIRARSTSTFIRGGKNRQPRLAVLDATAVDTRRRLVLIRRDDVEHLIMIGGPSDIVIESRIVHPADDQVAPPQAAPAQKAAPQRTEPQPEPMPRPAPAAAQKPMSPARPQPQPQPQPQPRRPEPVREPELARSPSPPPPPQPSPSAPASSPAVAAAAAGTAATAAGAVGSIRAEAFEVLESARARVFEEPSFDEAAYEELTSAPEPAPRAATAPSPAASHTPGPSSYTPAPAFERATGSPATPPQASRPPVRPVPGDFESVLAAELSEDLSLDGDGDIFEPLEHEPLDLAFEIDRDEAPEVKPDSPPSRDSLEAEMERLLGDLSRKP